MESKEIVTTTTKTIRDLFNIKQNNIPKPEEEIYNIDCKKMCLEIHR